MPALDRQPGWRWLSIVGIDCSSCEHLQTGQPAPGSDYESTCGHPDRGSSLPIPESCEPDPAGFSPGEQDPESSESYVPSWCGRLPRPDTPCALCHGPVAYGEATCDECAAWLDERMAEEIAKDGGPRGG
jgi:hypothetical protein